MYLLSFLCFKLNKVTWNAHEWPGIRDDPELVTSLYMYNKTCSVVQKYFTKLTFVTQNIKQSSTAANENRIVMNSSKLRVSGQVSLLDRRGSYRPGSMKHSVVPSPCWRKSPQSEDRYVLILPWTTLTGETKRQYLRRYKIIWRTFSRRFKISSTPVWRNQKSFWLQKRLHS